MRTKYPFEPTTAYILGTATNLLMNYVRIIPGVPKRLHFTDDYIVERTIADQDTGKPKKVRSRVFWVDEEDGENAAKTLSILSEKLDAIMIPYLPDKGYVPYDFLITQIGDGFMKDWNVQVMKRPE